MLRLKYDLINDLLLFVTKLIWIFLVLLHDAMQLLWFIMGCVIGVIWDQPCFYRNCNRWWLPR